MTALRLRDSKLSLAIPEHDGLYKRDYAWADVEDNGCLAG